MPNGEDGRRDAPLDEPRPEEPQGTPQGSARGSGVGGDAAGGADRREAPGPRGFRSQPLGLRILLVASLSALGIGVVRCAIELTAVRPPVTTVGVERALVEVDGAIGGAPPDSLAGRAARLCAEALREAGTADVRLASPRTTGFDVVARLRISGSNEMIRVAVGIVDGSSGRALMETGGEGGPGMLGGLLNAAAVRAARELGIAGHDSAGGEGAAGQAGGA
jgi:hypothetical protein